MIRILDLRNIADLSSQSLKDELPRAAVSAADAMQAVEPLILDVRARGEEALREHAEKFDGVTEHQLSVPATDIAGALRDADPELVSALQLMIERVRAGSSAQVPAETTQQIVPGGTITQRWQPVSRVGLYVPGGKAVYPSSVVMNAVAAQSAGVSEIALASPVQRDSGGVHPTILTAAALLGIEEVYAIGGASAIAAFAYGVPELGLQPVDVVTGPGNIYVAAAKRYLRGMIGIDSEAGTTEILVVADAGANPRYVAADLLSQAEHDEAAASVLVTNSEALANATLTELDEMVANTMHSERARTALGGAQSAVILVNSIADGLVVSDSYAPEHLSIQTENAESVGRSAKNAGAIFIGPYTPVSLGDYLAGSNHVLPTGGTARFAAGLGAYTFLRPQQLVQYDSNALSQAAPAVNVLARYEGLPAHAEAVNERGA